MDEGDPLCLGAAGLSPKADRVLMPLMANADCILLLGYDPIEMRIAWRNPWNAGQTVIESAPVGSPHGMHRTTHVLTGEIAKTLAALATLTSQGLPIVICVLVDDSLSLIEMKQRGTQRPNLGVDFGAPGVSSDFAALAHAFGGHGVNVTDTTSLQTEARAALARNTFTVIAAHIPRRAYDDAI